MRKFLIGPVFWCGLLVYLILAVGIDNMRDISIIEGLPSTIMGAVAYIVFCIVTKAALDVWSNE